MLRIKRPAPPGRLVVRDDASCRRLLELLPSVREAAIDCEWDGLDDRTVSVPQSVQLAWDGHEVFVHEAYLPRLKPWVDDAPTGVFYSAKGDLWWLANAHLNWKGRVWDVMVEDYLLDENTKGDFEESLKARHAAIFDHPPRRGYKERFGKMSVREILAAGREEELVRYGCDDARETWELHLDRRARLEKLSWTGDDSMWDYFVQLDAPFTAVLFKMERRGCRLDVPFLGEIQQQAADMLQDLERRFYKACSQHVDFSDKKSGFNRHTIMNSPKQLKALFYDVLKYPAQYHMVNAQHGEKTRKLTTDVEALEALAAQGHEIPRIMTEFRRIGKLKGTYMDGLLSRMSHTGRVHTDFQQAFTLTGRLASRNPNLQNVPRTENDPFGIRSAFIPSDGMMLVGGDFSQIETRLMAHVSGDEAMIAACETSDIYSTMAAFLFHQKPEFYQKVNGEFVNKSAKTNRQIVKAIVLGVGFGKMSKSIASDLGISVKEADNFMNMYFGKFRRFRAWMKHQVRECREKGYVRTLTGRYRRIPEIRSSEFWKMAHAERQALNSSIQGGAFDIIKKVMLNLDTSGVLAEHGAHLILQIHDELLVECPKAEVKALLPKIKEIAEHPFEQDLKVSIPFETFYGMDWGSAKG